jgi:hypothetical protein
MRCTFCDDEIFPNDPTIMTTTREVVHLRCAEHDAMQAWRQRRWMAIIQSILSAGMLVLAWSLGVAVEGRWLMVLGLLLAHFGLHHRWWYYVLRDIRRAIQRTGRR